MLTEQAQVHVQKVESDLTAQAQQHVKQVESNLTSRAEQIVDGIRAGEQRKTGEAVRQTVVQAEAIRDEKIKHLTAEAQTVILKVRQDKDDAILIAQQSQRRVQELEHVAATGNEFVHGLQQQATAQGQSAAQKVLALENSHQELQAEKQRIVNLAHA